MLGEERLLVRYMITMVFLLLGPHVHFGHMRHHFVIILHLLLMITCMSDSSVDRQYLLCRCCVKFLAILLKGIIHLSSLAHYCASCLLVVRK